MKMFLIERGIHLMRAFLLSYGPQSVKKIFWDKEFSSGKWNFIDDTAGDCVYQHLEKWARNGRVLDLGCGPGNTACEMAENCYSTYIGVDISQEALDKATRRTEASGRSQKNTFVCSDFLGFKPAQKFDVILFRESMYHIPMGKIKPILDKYSQWLQPDGVFIVRMFMADRNDGRDKERPTKMMNIVESNFDIIEKGQYGKGKATVLVFRPKSVPASA
jgi:2-polyprenyl-3-methyl-5-hydroxy-6-metoxy-1,4-benzoquinol methylase